MPWESRLEMSANCIIIIFFPLKPPQQLVAKQILISLHIQLFIKHLLIRFQKMKIPNATPVDAIMAFLQ